MYQPPYKRCKGKCNRVRDINDFSLRKGKYYGSKCKFCEADERREKEQQRRKSLSV